MRDPQPRKKSAILSCLIMAAFSAGTVANNGLDSVTFEEPRRFYVDCLAEYVTGTLYVTATGHFLETPSGNVHIIDSWTYTLEVTGESTGRTWVSRNGRSPLADNILKSGEILSFTDSALLVPVTDGPSWRYNFNAKIRLDENGDVILDSGKAATGTLIRCLGPDS